MRRRDFLTASGGLVAAGLAGCLYDECDVGETWSGVGVSIATPRATRTNDGWRLECRLEVNFNFARSDDLGLEGAAVAVYDSEKRRLTEAELGDITWGDVPASQRDKDDCGYRFGSDAREVTVELPAFPYWIAPTADQFRGHRDERRGLVYAGDNAPTDGPATNYESRSFHSHKNWPPIDDNAADDTGFGVRATEFNLGECDPSTASTSTEWFSDERGGVRIAGTYSLDHPCHRPLLRSTRVEDDRLIVTVGSRRVERAECPDDCSERRYHASITTEEKRAASAVKLVHVGADETVRHTEILHRDSHG